MIGRIALSVGLVGLAHAGHAHHSSIGIYDEENSVEIEGVVTEVRWRNPHPSYTVAVTDDDGNTVDWFVETGSVSTLRLRGIERDFIEVGDRVHLAGQASLRGRAEMFAENMLLPDGREVMMRAVSKPYWPAGRSGNFYERGVDQARAAEGRRTAQGMFRVWSPIFDDPAAYPLYGAGISQLTPAAQAIKAAYDPRGSGFTECRAKGMPYIMGTAYPLEFIAQGEDILIQIEEFDSQRLIHMNAPASEAPDEHTRLGFSRGHWEGDTLVVETSGVEASYLYSDGTPHSDQISLVERFDFNAQEERLYYELEITDPEHLTETLEFSRFWVWEPDIRIQSYDCGNAR
jgi:hypothetical protein